MTLMSQEELARAKEALRGPAPSGAAAQPGAISPSAIWRLVHFPTAAQAVNFANINPVQKGGEFGMAADPAGGFDGYYFF